MKSVSAFSFRSKIRQRLIVKLNNFKEIGFFGLARRLLFYRALGDGLKNLKCLFSFILFLAMSHQAHGFRPLEELRGPVSDLDLVLVGEGASEIHYSPLNWDAHVVPVKEYSWWQMRDLHRLMPGKEDIGLNEKVLAQKTLDRGLRLLVKKLGQESQLMRVAHMVKESVRADFHFVEHNRQGESISHRFRLKMEAFRQRASLNYRGLFDLQFTYHLSSKATELEFEEELGEQTRLLLKQSFQAGESLSIVQFRYDY